MSKTDGSIMASTGSEEYRSSSVTGHEGKVSSSRWLEGEGQSQVDHMSLLPPELQYCITNYLDAKDFRNCRLVSSGWKNMMDKLHAHDVVLDQRVGFRGKLDISLKSCTIVSLGKINCRPLFVNAAWKPKTVTIVLGINKWNLFEMNNNWNNVTVLDLNWKSMASNSMFTLVKTSRRSKIFLPQLSSLKIGIPNFSNLTLRTSQTRNIIFNGVFIFSQRFPWLRDLSIDFVLNTSIAELLPDIMDFIGTHSTSLINLDIKMMILSYYSPTRHLDNASTILLPVPQIPIAEFDAVEETLINSVHYKFTSTVERYNQNLEEWRNFLRNGDPVGTVRLSRIITEKIMNFQLRIIDFYEGMIAEVSQFITVLRLTGLTLFTTPINANIFGSLTNLETLILKRNPALFESTFHPEMQNSVQITHLVKLPTSLKHLTIQGFAGESKDLKKMVVTLKNLVSLDFTQDSISIIPNFDTGFDLLALEKLIRHPRLEEVTVSLARHISYTFLTHLFQQLYHECNWSAVHYTPGFIGLFFIPDKISLFKTENPKNIIMPIE